MYWERVYLRQAEPWTNGGTLKLDLPKSGKLGSIMVHAYRAGVTDAFNAQYKWRLIDYISKIEVLYNGTRPIKSLTGEECKGLSIFDGMGSAPDQEFNYGSSTKRAHFMLNFGRRLFDKRYFLDLGRFDSVEIQLTNDGSSTYFGGNWSVDLLMYMLRGADAPASQGYFRTEDWKSWTTVQNTWQYLDLPTELMLRRLLLHVLPAHGTNQNADTQGYNVVDQIKLMQRARTEHIWDQSLRELWYENYMTRGREFLSYLEPYHTGGYGVKTGLGQVLGKAIGQMPQGGTPVTPTIALEPGNDGDTQKLLRTGSDNYSMIMGGLAPENCAVIEFDQDADNPNSWLDLAAVKPVNLDVHTKDSASADNGVVRVVLDRLVPA